MINPNQLGRRAFPAGASQWMLVGLRGAPPPPVGLNDGDPVTTWTDSSVNGNNATMTGSNRPTFKTAIVNGKPVVRFTSAGQSKLNLTTPISGAFPWIVFAVMKATLGNRIDTLDGNGASGVPLGISWLTDGTLFLYTQSAFMGTVGATSVGFHVIEGIYGSAPAGGHFILVDGVSAGNAGTFTVSTNSGNFVSLGYDSITPTYGNGDIAEIIIYAAAISGSDRQNIEKYLGTKYGIAVPGGTAAQPDTVAGLAGWWKADSLGT